MCEFRVGKPKTQERARGPTHTRRIPYRIEIPAPSPGCTGVVRRDLPYVVEGHASACPQTVRVDVKCVALTLIKLKYYVSASILKGNNQFELL